MNATDYHQTLLSFDDLIRAVDGEAEPPITGGFSFSSVVTDSRNVVAGSLFVPLIGEKQDGHTYIEAALTKGATAVFIAQAAYAKDPAHYGALMAAYPSVAFIRVRDTLRALQDAAAAYAERFPSLVKIGVTGSSGKTTTKDMLVSTLSKKYRVVATQGNLNSETGLPLSVFAIRAEHEVGIFELGMNRTDEIAESTRVLKPQYAVITNIGTAHIGILGSRENIAKEKRRIFDFVGDDGAAFVPAEDDFADFLAQGVRGAVLYFGRDVSEQESGVRFIQDAGLAGSVFAVDGVRIQLGVPGIYNYRNALAAIALARHLGLSAAEMKGGLEHFRRAPGRMEMLQLTAADGARITLVNDCYNANPESMSGALDFCDSVSGCAAKIYVLGDMLELGAKSQEEHTKMGSRAARGEPDTAVFVGPEMAAAYRAAVAAGFRNAVHIPDASEHSMELLGALLQGSVKDACLVLLKASRGMALERVIPMLSGAEGADK